MPLDSVQCSAVQCRAVHYSAVQCSAVQCRAVKYGPTDGGCLGGAHEVCLGGELQPQALGFHKMLHLVLFRESWGLLFTGAS